MGDIAGTYLVFIPRVWSPKMPRFSKPSPDPDPLEGRKGAFVREYLVDLNPTAAARRAGYAPSGASGCASRLLKTPRVKREIRAAMEDRIERTQVTQDLVVTELARIAFGNLSDVMSWGPDGIDLVPSADLTPDQAAGVQDVSTATGKDAGTLRLKRHDKVKALELLGRHLGVFSDRADSLVDTPAPLSDEDRLHRVSALMALAAQRAALEESPAQRAEGDEETAAQSENATSREQILDMLPVKG